MQKLYHEGTWIQKQRVYQLTYVPFGSKKTRLPSALVCENRELEDVYVLYITSYCLQQAIVFTPCRQAEEKLCVLVKNLCECVSFSMDACAHMLYMQMCANFAWKRGRVEVSINHCPVLSFVYVCVFVSMCSVRNRRWFHTCEHNHRAGCFLLMVTTRICRLFCVCKMHLNTNH